MQAPFAPFTAPESVDRLVANAERCFRLARWTSDQGVARRLLELGGEYVVSAIALGADPHELLQPDREIGPLQEGGSRF